MLLVKSSSSIQESALGCTHTHQLTPLLFTVITLLLHAAKYMVVWRVQNVLLLQRAAFLSITLCSGLTAAYPARASREELEYKEKMLRNRYLGTCQHYTNYISSLSRNSFRVYHQHSFFLLDFSNQMVGKFVMPLPGRQDCLLKLSTLATETFPYFYMYSQYQQFTMSTHKDLALNYTRLNLR